LEEPRDRNLKSSVVSPIGHDVVVLRVFHDGGDHPVVSNGDSREEDNENEIYSSIQELRDRTEELQSTLESRESNNTTTSNGGADVNRIREEIARVSNQILEKNEERHKARSLRRKTMMNQAWVTPKQ